MIKEFSKVYGKEIIYIEHNDFTPAHAIKQECKYCSNGQRINCNTTVCKLSKSVMTASPLKRIKAHCLDCVGGKKGVKECDGKVLNPDPHICPLYKFRNGKNPNRKGIEGNPNIHLVNKK